MPNELDTETPAPEQGAQDEKPTEPSAVENADAGGERESSESEKDASSQDDDKPRKRRASQRISELVAINKAKDAEIERLIRLAQRGDTAPAPSDDTEPKREDFEDYEAFVRADARWQARQEFRQLTEQQQAQQRQQQHEREAAAVQQRWDESHEAALDRYDDYEEMFEAVGTSITGTHASAIRNADDPAEVVYWLGKNPKEFAKFKDLSGVALLKAVGRIEERIHSQRAQQSKAPPPVAPIKGSTPTPNKLTDDLPPEKWLELRNKQVYGR